MTASPITQATREAARAMRLAVKAQTMLVEAQTVMTLRTLGMFGLWPMGAQETSRMFTEKLEAMQEAQVAVMRAAMKGADPTAMAEAALRPVRRRTKANAERLTRRAED